MSKPLFRFTVGPCLKQGLEILIESIKRTTTAFGIDRFDWCICHNGLSEEELQFVQKGVNRPMLLFPQDWGMCPVQDHVQTPKREDGSFNYDGNRCGGTMWKVCPPRMRMESHEIIMDNDIVVLRKFKQIDEWLSQTEKVLVLEENIRFYGRYDRLHGPAPFLNSGLIGLPPGYDFGHAISTVWASNGHYTNLSQSDEQGLLTFALIQMPNIRIQPNQVIEILGRDYNARIHGSEEAIHFVQSNRMPNHRAWLQYRELMDNTAII
jgi:hypothetical protein